MDIQGIGQYYGTELDGKWWKRYRKAGYFVRGLGRYWVDESGFVFRRYLLPSEIHIPYGSISSVKLGAWHAGKWAAGRHVLKLEWQDGEHHLVSGFTLLQPPEAMLTLMKAIAPRLDPDR